MVSEDRESWSFDLGFENVVYTCFCVLNVGSRELVLRVVGYEIAGIHSPSWGCNRIPSAGHRSNGL